jgi:hypothetical protein
VISGIDAIRRMSRLEGSRNGPPALEPPRNRAAIGVFWSWPVSGKNNSKGTGVEGMCSQRQGIHGAGRVQAVDFWARGDYFKVH